MPKLTREVFDKAYRFRNSRGRAESSGAARCQLCIHCQGGHCVHPERVRRVALSEPSFLKNHARHDLAPLRVCDLVEIPIPDGIEVPEVNEMHGVVIHGCNDPPANHGNPRCAYVAAALADKGWTEFGDHITVHSFADAARIYHSCELPGCIAKFGVPSGSRDEYMTRQGFADESVPPPPNPVVPDDPREEAQHNTGELAELLKPVLWPFGDGQNWPREAQAGGARTVQGLMNHYTLHHQPPWADRKYHIGIAPCQLEIALTALGWGPVSTGWMTSSPPGFHGHSLDSLPWTDDLAELGVQYVRLVSRLPNFEAAEPSEGNKGQPRVEWKHWHIILDAVGWKPVADRIAFLTNVLYGGYVICPRCEDRDLPEYYFGPRHKRWPNRYGSKPSCPECHSDLVTSDYLSQKYRD